MVLTACQSPCTLLCLWFGLSFHRKSWQCWWCRQGSKSHAKSQYVTCHKPTQETLCSFLQVKEVLTFSVGALSCSAWGQLSPALRLARPLTSAPLPPSSWMEGTPQGASTWDMADLFLDSSFSLKSLFSKHSFFTDPCHKNHVTETPRLFPWLFAKICLKFQKAYLWCEKHDFMYWNSLCRFILLFWYFNKISVSVSSMFGIIQNEVRHE